MIIVKGGEIMKPLDKNDAIKLINAIFPSMELNHINDYEYIFIEPKNPVIKRNVGRLISKVMKQRFHWIYMTTVRAVGAFSSLRLNCTVTLY